MLGNVPAKTMPVCGKTQNFLDQSLRLRPKGLLSVHWHTRAEHRTNQAITPAFESGSTEFSKAVLLFFCVGHGEQKAENGPAWY